MLYRGLYETIRHPQAIGEAFVWFPIAFFLNSPFLVLYSFLWIPIFYIMCIAEERDLEMRYGTPYIECKERVGFLIPRRSKNWFKPIHVFMGAPQYGQNLSSGLRAKPQ
ncbi:MAG: methyltransferase family protein [Candidatus Thorarchaeota archaeon]